MENSRMGYIGTTIRVEDGFVLWAGHFRIPRVHEN